MLHRPSGEDLTCTTTEQGNWNFFQVHLWCLQWLDKSLLHTHAICATKRTYVCFVFFFFCAFIDASLHLLLRNRAFTHTPFTEVSFRGIPWYIHTLLIPITNRSLVISQSLYRFVIILSFISHYFSRLPFRHNHPAVDSTLLCGVFAVFPGLFAIQQQLYVSLTLTLI